jgi:hypothetical protein
MSPINAPVNPHNYAQGARMNREWEITRCREKCSTAMQSAGYAPRKANPSRKPAHLLLSERDAQSRGAASLTGGELEHFTLDFLVTRRLELEEK